MYMCMYLVGLDWLEASAKVLKLVPLLMNLHPLSVVLDLGIHAVRTLLDRRSNSTTSLCLQAVKRL